MIVQASLFTPDENTAIWQWIRFWSVMAVHSRQHLIYCKDLADATVELMRIEYAAKDDYKRILDCSMCCSKCQAKSLCTKIISMV